MQAIIARGDPQPLPEPRFAPRLLALGVLALTALLFFTRLGARALWASEFRWAEIAREMHVTGNYFWPTINGRLYYDKPLLSYWLVLGAAWMTGGLNEAAARVPCAIAGLLAVGLLMFLARRLYEWRTAVWAGFILATSMSFVFLSRHASADVETITGELAALALFLYRRDRQGGWWVLALWLIMAVTSLTKGLLGFVLPTMVIGVYSCWSEGWRELYRAVTNGSWRQRIEWISSRNRWLFNLKTIPAVALAGAVYALPFAISSAREGSGAGFYLVYRENIVRFFHPFDHRGPVYLYVYAIFALMAPWSALLPAALAQAHKRREAERGNDRFALVFFWATFAFFTLSGSRRSYYILPILPAAALLVARVLTTPREEMAAGTRILLRTGYAAIVVLLAAGAVMLLPTSMRPAQWRAYPPTPDRAAFGVFWIVSVVTAVYALRNFRPSVIAISTGTVAYLSMTYLYIFAMPAAERYRGEKSFGAQIVRELHGDMSELAFFRTQGPLFYLDPPRPVAEYDDPTALKDAVQTDGIRWVVTRRRDVAMLTLSTQIVAGEATFPWEDQRDVRNKQVLLKLIDGGQ